MLIYNPGDGAAEGGFVGLIIGTILPAPKLFNTNDTISHKAAVRKNARKEFVIILLASL